MNVFTFSGSLPRPAEQRRTQSDKAVVSFSVPVDAGFGDKKTTTWVDCTIWGKKAESRLHEYLKKGTFVVVTGEAKLETFTKKDGTNGAKLAVNVSEVTLGRGSNNGTGEGQDNYQSQGEPDWGGDSGQGGGHSTDLGDDIPFNAEWR